MQIDSVDQLSICWNPDTWSGTRYPWTPYRVEWRPRYALDDKASLEKMLDALSEAGVKAWWYAAAAKSSIPLFRSQYLPHHEDANDEVFQWLTRECKERGISIFSWEYINSAPLLAIQRPEWRYQWFDDNGKRSNPRESHFVCYNSPYGQLLMDYCLEVIGKLGFEGIWFDGSTLTSVGTPKQRIGCCCEFCREKYKQQTGHPLPEHLNLDDPDFRRYINWRYADFTDYWARLSSYVAGSYPDAIIAVNHFNRLTGGWATGCPLWRTPMKAMISTEVGGLHNHLLLHHAYHRAINNNFPVEVWDYLCDGVALEPYARPEPDPTAPTFVCLASATCGGFSSFGLGSPPQEVQNCLKSITDAVSPVAPYVGGRLEACVGLVLSGATKDFSYSDSYISWKHVHGAHNLLNGLHLPTDIILDNMFDEQTLSQYQAIVLPDIRCLSEKAASELRAYVQRGGVLLVCGEIGTHDLNGDRYPQPILDDFFSIEHRHETKLTHAILDIQHETMRMAGMPARYMISGACRPVDVGPNVEVLAETSYSTEPGKKWSAKGLVKPSHQNMKRGVAVLAKEYGKGRAVWIRPEITLGYAEQPNRRSRQFVQHILEQQGVRASFTTDAPPNVLVAPWRQDQRVAIHLLNVPSAMLRLAGDQQSRIDHYWPEDVVPTGPIHLQYPGQWKQAWSPTSKENLSFSCSENRIDLTLDRLEQHAVIILS